MNIVWGMKILLIFFWGSSHNWTIFRGHFRVFFKVKVQNGGYFFGLLKFQILFGVLEIPVIFFFWGGVNSRCWA